MPTPLDYEEPVFLLFHTAWAKLRLIVAFVLLTELAGKPGQDVVAQPGDTTVEPGADRWPVTGRPPPGHGVDPLVLRS